MACRTLTAFIVALVLLAVVTDAKVFRAKGSKRSDLDKEIKKFRDDVGPDDSSDPHYSERAGFGRHEVDWDLIPDTLSAPNTIPFNYYNSPSLATPQGIELYPVGFDGKLMVSNGNAFDQKSTNEFSEPRALGLVDTNEVWAFFYHPGTHVQSFVRGFGAVFLNAQDSTKIEFYDIKGDRIEDVSVPSEKGGYSFAGYTTDDHDIYYVRVRLGDEALDEDGKFDDDDSGVLMDDMIWSLVQDDNDFQLWGAAGNDVGEAVIQFKNALGEQNENIPQCFSGGFRAVDWDALPDSQCDPNRFQGAFFDADAAPRARGVRFRSDGPALFVSSAPDTSAPVNFGIDELVPFSEPRMFAPADSVQTAVTWRLPCVQYTEAAVRGFGTVFVNVRGADVAWANTFHNEVGSDLEDNLDESISVPPFTPGQQPHSFSGIISKRANIEQVQLIAGRAEFRANGRFSGPHPVVVDDVVFSEPEGSPQQAPFGSVLSSELELTSLPSAPPFESFD